VVLPKGSVHALSWVMAPGVDAPGHALWLYAAKAAVVRGRPVAVRIGRTSGQVDAYTVTAAGTRHRHLLARHTTPAGSPDPRWSEPPPNSGGLLQAVSAAERAGDFEAAIAAVGRLGARLEADLGEDHPAPWMAAELQADLALLIGRWERAIPLYCKVAIARYALRSPEVSAIRCLRLAALAWLRVSDRPTAGPAGLALAHTLIAYLPDRTDLLCAVLCRLPDRLLPAQSPPGTKTTPRTPH
jgi:hypothetical protein